MEIIYKSKRYEVPEGISLKQLQMIVDGEVKGVIGALVNNVPTGLNTKLYQNKTVEFITLDDQFGQRIYLSSLIMLLSKAADEVLKQSRIRIEHSISGGYMTFIYNGEKPANASEVEKIKARMEELIKADIPYMTYNAPTQDVIKMFEESGREDVAELLKYHKTFYTKYFSIDGYTDYSLMDMVPSTSYLTQWNLTPYFDGYLLQIPRKAGSEELPLVVQMPKLYGTYKNLWSLEHKARLTGIAAMNNIEEEYVSSFIQISEAIHEKNIVRIADSIISNPDVKIVLIAGPSSSGKTTFSKRLSVQIEASGIRPTALSLDNYFVNRECNPVDENGELDFESLYSLDLERLSTDLNKLIKGEAVETPIYDFTTGKRSATTIPMQIGKNEMLVIEGTHALNPELSKALPRNSIFKVFVSALNTMSVNDHICIPADDTRLLRRIIRDYKYRNYSAEETILRWPSVRRGEVKWIEPYQEEADAMFNSTLPFELAAVCSQAMPLLMDVPHYSAAYPVAYRLRAMLRFLKPISYKDIPSTSLLREFLGGSGFRY